MWLLVMFGVGCTHTGGPTDSSKTSGVPTGSTGSTTTTDVGTTPGDTDTTRYGYDWDAVTAWVDAYVAEIQAAGACPTSPPSAMIQLDGTDRKSVV